MDTTDLLSGTPKKCRHHDVCRLEGDALVEEDSCVLHARDPGKDFEAFVEALAAHRKRCRGKYDFIVFPERFGWVDDQSRGLSFFGATFHGPVKLRGNVQGPLVFFGATFKSAADFSEAEFADGANFSSATFEDEADFLETRFHRKAEFRDTVFGGFAQFNTASFGAPAVFSDARFNARAYFYNATFAHRADFDRAVFAKEASFESARFQDAADFVAATFSDTTFSQCAFAGGARFTNATFEGDAVFHFVKFGSDTEFFRSEHCGDTSFGSAEFAGRALFSYSRFSAKARFTNVTHADAVSFRGAVFEGSAEFSKGAGPDAVAAFDGIDVDFREAEASGRLVFRDVDLSRARLLGADLRHAALIGVTWARIERLGFRFGAYDEIVPLDAGAARPFSRLEQLYRDLKHNYEANNDYERAGDFHFGAMEMRRQQPQTPPSLRFFLTVYWLISGYGERYLRPLVCLLGLVLVTTFAQLGLGAVTPPGAALALSNPGDWLTVAHFALRSMLLLKPDNVVFSPAGEFIVTLQNVLGPVFVGLFALALRQRLKR